VTPAENADLIPALDPMTKMAIDLSTERVFSRFKDYLDDKLDAFSSEHPTLALCTMQHAGIATQMVEHQESIERARKAMEATIEGARRALEKPHTELVDRVATLESGLRGVTWKVALIIGGAIAVNALVTLLALSGRI